MSEQSSWQRVTRSGPLALALAVLGPGALILALVRRTNDPAVIAATEAGLQPPYASGLDLALLIGYFPLFSGAFFVAMRWWQYRSAPRYLAEQEAEVQRLVESHTGRATHLLRLRRAELVELAVRIEHLRTVSNLTEQDAAGLQQVLAGELVKNDRAARWPRRLEALFWYLLGLATSLILFFAAR